MSSLNQGDTHEQRSEQIERDIEATRAGIKEDLRALGEKVSPGRLKQDAVQAVKDRSVRARDAVVDRVDEIGRGSWHRLQAGATKLRENPLAFAGGALVVGLGLGLALPTTEGEARLFAKPARKARAQAREILQEGRETTRRVRDEFQEDGAEAKAALRGSEGSALHH